jgi:hypothetical protein
MAEYLCEADMSTGECISRDVALRQLNATCLAIDCDNYNGVRCRACAYADAMDFIDAIPVADVQPVKHGRWEDCEIRGSLAMRCSVCGNDSGVLYNYAYCPNCGARMDGE